ncbi:DNA alkylation repair protein [Arthrobacter sp. NamB2]|uniref:DNA alkylation repair protein n=1 Tax=Arthrobacter sp. NamB2 TaxID=2576035 RepID=UPI0010CA150E|nr:DNA alkylation repair protein [Arthrobacter sp. NamB2]TKV28141.1 DNA alkylation repair protein [Arthrobacter sp. NamB2]
MSDPAEFIDESLQYESSWERAEDHQRRYGTGLEYYGASVGAVRGTVRNAERRYPGLGHDDVTALAAELWARPVFERRLAAVVLLQSFVPLLRHSDLTRIEGFLRSAQVPDLVDPLAIDVVGTLLLRLKNPDAARARTVVDRWAAAEDALLRRAAVLVHLPAFRAGEGDDAAFRRTVRLVSSARQGRVPTVEDAVALVRASGAG